jgi:GntR family transcriptional regulator, transcriptional repressor for pyruvate dehydrogenase complex
VSTFAIPQIRRATVTELAIESLLGLIRQGLIRPGDRLPAQRELVSQMGLSRPAVREALRGLASLGMIEIIAGRGAFVKRIAPEALINPEALSFLLERETVLHAIEVRQILEVEAIGLAAERATAEDLAEMEKVLQQIRDGLGDGEKPLRHAPYFHLAIAKATHNPVLMNMVKSFVRLMTRAAEVIAERVPAAKAREYRLHAELYEAIAARDPHEARRRMREHLEESKSLVLQGFAESKA